MRSKSELHKQPSVPRLRSATNCFFAIVMTTLLSGPATAGALSGTPTASAAEAMGETFSADNQATSHTNKAGAGASGQAISAPRVCWQDANVKPLAIILCLHGLGLHKGTFEAIGKRFAHDGIITYAIDMPGFGEQQKNNQTAKIDFPTALQEVRATLEDIHTQHPDLPIVLLGESMGGAVAVHATSEYPQLVSGLIASVPAGDRFGQTEEELKVGIHAMLNGFGHSMNVGKGVVEQATQKPELRKEWENDPLGRMDLSPKELMSFQHFMNKNFECASKISSVPVLFVQGMQDKLVRPAGTWRLYDSVATPAKELVFSKSAEHLIFEESQFNPDDVRFVESWLAKRVLTAESADALTKVAGAGARASNPTQTAGGTSDRSNVEAPESAPTQAASQTANSDPNDFELPPERTGLSYWIELLREGKIYRCNNKSVFKTGDAIRFHFLPSANGYAYIVMKHSSTGKGAVLFPDTSTGLANMLSAGQDYALPTKAWLKFDAHSGVELVSLVFSRKPIDQEKADTVEKLAYISSERDGSKDLVPTRMQLSWNDPDPVIMPTEFSPMQAQSARLASNSSNQSLVHITQEGNADAFSVDIALTHL